MYYVFSSRLAHTPEKETIAVLTKDMSFVHNLSEAEKMELIPKINHNMYWAFSLFSLVVIGRGDVLAAGNPSKERHIWKVKCEARENM